MPRLEGRLRGRSLPAGRVATVIRELALSTPMVTVGEPLRKMLQGLLINSEHCIYPKQPIALCLTDSTTNN
jgi:hypothetical protein